MKNRPYSVAIGALTFASIVGIGVSGPAGAAEMDRTTLPIQEPKRPTYTELDARNVKAPPRFDVKAPAGAPNVVIVLIDDIGFGGPSTFGGPIRTPTFDALAANGIRFNNFHTTALCSPTRVALKSGRNHHTANAGSIMETVDRLSGQHRTNSQQRGAAGRDAAPEWLQHRCLRQVARDRRVGDQRVGSIRPLAHAPGLRQVLWIHRRRNRPVVSVDL